MLIYDRNQGTIVNQSSINEKYIKKNLFKAP